MEHKRQLSSYSKRQKCRIIEKQTKSDITNMICVTPSNTANNIRVIELSPGSPRDVPMLFHHPDNHVGLSNAENNTDPNLRGVIELPPGSPGDVSMSDPPDNHVGLSNISDNENSYGSLSDVFTDASLDEMPAAPSKVLGSPIETQSERNNSFRNDLANWAIKFDINHNAISALLVLLKTYTNFDLPNDARTLLKTPRTISIQPIGGGHYWHYGLANVLKQIYNDLQNLSISIKCIQLIMNIDGLPIAKSSTACFWPILVSELTLKQVYIVGCFYGNEKPRDSNEFIQPITDELIYYVHNGFIGEYDDVPINVSLHALVCDAPAKSFLLKVKGHSGYNSCTKCTINGDYIDKRVCFPCIKGPCQPIERTDYSVNVMTDEDFHTGTTILRSIPNFGLVSQVPLDYMHLVCLGIMKKLLKLWFCGPLNVRLCARAIEEISKNLVSLRLSIPDEFQRKPRELKYRKQWKATEFRQLLIYSGPVVLKKYLQKDVLDNFLALHTAITILSKPELISDLKLLNYSDSLLKYFVRSFQEIYGIEHVSHNVHGLTHLVGDVKRLGPLDVFGAFKFESYLSKVKNVLRKSDRPLQQLAKRYIEVELNHMQSKLNVSKGINLANCLKAKWENVPLANISIDMVNNQFAIFKDEGLYINCKDEKNNTFMLIDGSISSVRNVIQLKPNDDIFIVCSGYKIIGDLYTLDSFKSSEVNIHTVQELEDLEIYKLSDIKCKLWRMKYGENFVVIPLGQHN